MKSSREDHKVNLKPTLYSKLRAPGRHRNWRVGFQSCLSKLSSSGVRTDTPSSGLATSPLSWNLSSTLNFASHPMLRFFLQATYLGTGSGFSSKVGTLTHENRFPVSRRWPGERKGAYLLSLYRTLKGPGGECSAPPQAEINPESQQRCHSTSWQVPIPKTCHKLLRYYRPMRQGVHSYRWACGRLGMGECRRGSEREKQVYVCVCARTCVQHITCKNLSKCGLWTIWIRLIWATYKQTDSGFHPFYTE